ncbi:MAG: hypothetical protein VXY93_20405, partial [Pseudomonadota bacterium]|nr:hypothetical protein [Pseudomonadota bacterium]
DGHTNLDNVSIAGVTTMTGMLRIDSGNLQIYGTAPTLFLRDTNDNPDYRIMNSHGSLKIFDEINGVDRLIINQNGKVSILYDLDVDGHTNLDNVSIAGVTTAFRIRLEDNRYLQIGNDSDLQLYHDGVNSYINEGGTGSLFIAGSALRLQSDDNRLNDANGNVIIKTDATSAYLYYEGSNRLNSTS